MRKKRLVTFLAVAAIVTTCFGGISTQANVVKDTIEQNANALVMPRFTAIVATSNGISKSGNLLTCVAKTETQTAYKAGVKIELQFFNSGWKTIKTWDETATTEFLRLSKDWNVDKGTYQLKLTHTAKNKDGSVKETYTDYSDSVTVQ